MKLKGITDQGFQRIAQNVSFSDIMRSHFTEGALQNPVPPDHPWHSHIQRAIDDPNADFSAFDEYFKGDNRLLNSFLQMIHEGQPHPEDE